MTICAWCTRTIVSGGEGPISHGMCKECFDVAIPNQLINAVGIRMEDEEPAAPTREFQKN